MSDLPLKASQETVRIPLYTTEESRLYSARNQATTYGAFEQQLVNCFPIVYHDPMRPESKSYRLVQRAGLYAPEPDVDLSTHVNDPDQCEIRAAIAFSSLKDVLVAAYYDLSNSKIYIVQHRPLSNTAVRIKEITPTGYTGKIQIFLSELKIGNTTNLGIVISGNAIGDKSEGWYAATSSGIFTLDSAVEITDVDFPPKQTPARKITGPMVQMDGYTFVLTEDGDIYNSDLNSITSWNTSGYVKAASKPDRGVTLTRYKHHIVAFGENSIEFFNNEGISAPNSPLERTNQAFISMGALGPKSVINIEDTIFWIGKSSTGALGLWRLDGYQPTLVSQPYMSYMLQIEPSFCNLQVISMQGTRHLITNIARTNNVGWLPLMGGSGSPTAITVGGDTDLTFTSHSYVVGQKLYLTGFTGAHAADLNNLWHTVTSVTATHVFLDTDTTGRTITLGSGLVQGDISPEDATLPGILCYCLDSNSWWNWAFEAQGLMNYSSVNGAGQIHVCRSNPATGETQSTWIWVGLGGTDNIKDNYGLHPCRLQDQYETQQNVGTFDTFRDGNATAFLYWRIPIIIITNNLDFGNENRKFIRKVKLVGDQLEWLSEGGSEPYISFRNEGLRLYLAYSRVENASYNPSEWTIRNIDIPQGSSPLNYLNEQRYYWNNLGACRSMKFAIFLNTWVPFRFEALETIVSQGIH